MILRHNRRSVPQLNTTSTADISFILLVFFLVMTSMDVDKGLQRQLPPPDNTKQEQTVEVAKGNLMDIRLDANSRLTVNGKPMSASQLRSHATAFISQNNHRQSHVIRLNVDRRASYDAYFNVQNELVAAYNTLRDQQAKRTYGRPYAQCTAEQRENVRQYYPQRITETTQTAEEGGER